MILRTEVVKFDIVRGDAIFNIQEPTTTELTDIAVKSGNDPAMGLEETFVKSITGWKNVSSPSGDLVCNDENKRLVFNANHSFVESIMNEVKERTEEKEEAEKKI